MSRVHGTRAGYQQHRVLLESPCDPCRLAYNEYQFKYKKARVLKARNGTSWDWYQRGHVDAVAACIAAVEALGGSLHTHFRMSCEPPSPVEWSKHRNCDPIDEIISALRKVQP